MPFDSESLLSAWEAMGPSNPFPCGLQDVCLAYFKNGQEQLDPSETDCVLTPCEAEFLPPPTRFVRKPRADRRAPPPGPASCEGSGPYPTECKKDCESGSRPSATASGAADVQIANGPEADRAQTKSHQLNPLITRFRYVPGRVNHSLAQPATHNTPDAAAAKRTVDNRVTDHSHSLI